VRQNCQEPEVSEEGERNEGKETGRRQAKREQRGTEHLRERKVSSAPSRSIEPGLGNSLLG
jgi:hypothetical protein